VPEPIAQKSILIFDSGYGGLSVLKQVTEHFPNHLIHYVADDAFFPFGGKEPTMLRSHLLDILPEYVRKLNPGCLVLACNTGFLIAGEALARALPIPVYGCAPPLERAVELSRTKLVSVIATSNTVAVLKQSVREDHQGKFLFIASDDLAPAVEALLRGDSVLDRIERELKKCFVKKHGRRVDVIVLACSHYPLIQEQLVALSPWPVVFIDSANAIFASETSARSLQGLIDASQVRIELTSGKAPDRIWFQLMDSIIQKAGHPQPLPHEV